MNGRLSRLFAMTLVTVFFAVSISCGGGGGGTVTPGFVSNPSAAVLQQAVGKAGARIQLPGSAGPLDGLILEIPAGALDSTVTITISYEQTARPADAKVGKWGPEVILGPAGLAFNLPVRLSIPFDGLTADDAVSCELRQTPTTAPVYHAPSEVVICSPNLVEITLMHFTSIRPIGIGAGLLPGSLDSGFDTTDEGWHQPNDNIFGGGGDCFGMSLFAIWYRANKRPTDPDLSEFLAGDPLREIKLRVLAHMFQLEAIKLWTELMTNAHWQGITSMTGDQRAAAIVFQLWLTGRPQVLVLQKSTGGPTHAVVVKSYDAVNKRFVIADPNYPGETRYIPYDPATGWGTYDGYDFFYLDFSEEVMNGNAGANMREKFQQWLDIARQCTLMSIWLIISSGMQIPGMVSPISDFSLTVDSAVTPVVDTSVVTLHNIELPTIWEGDTMYFAAPLYYGVNRLTAGLVSEPVLNASLKTGYYTYPARDELIVNTTDTVGFAPEQFRLWLLWDNPDVNLDLWVASPDGESVWSHEEPFNETGGFMIMWDYQLSTAESIYESMQEMFVAHYGSPGQPHTADDGTYTCRVGYRTGTEATNWRLVGVWGNGALDIVHGSFAGPGTTSQDETGFLSGGSGWSELYRFMASPETVFPTLYLLD